MEQETYDVFDEILTETEEKNWLARAMWIILGILLITLSASTTAAFFLRYAGQVFAGLVGPTLSPYIAAIAGVIVLDLGALVWAHLRANHANTAEQMSIARLASIIDLIGSLVATFLFLALGTSFEIGIYTATGELSTLGQALHYTGLALIVIGVSGNFALLFLYSGAGANVRKALQDRQLEAQVSSSRYRADKARAEMMARKALHNILAQLPALTDTAGADAAARYLRQNISNQEPGRPAASMEAQLIEALSQMNPDEIAELFGGAPAGQTRSRPTRATNGQVPPNG